jgi:putative transposase
VCPRRPRLTEQQYLGRCRYSLTLCTSGRHKAFIDKDAVTLTLSQILRAGKEHRFALTAYCFMPDHVHLLVEGCAPHCNLERYVHAAKQFSGFAYARHAERRLWQHSYFDHALRGNESTQRAVRYILENPIRAGLVRIVDEYPFSGSETLTWKELLELVGSSGQRP